MLLGVSYGITVLMSIPDAARRALSVFKLVKFFRCRSRGSIILLLVSIIIFSGQKPGMPDNCPENLITLVPVVQVDCTCFFSGKLLRFLY